MDFAPLRQNLFFQLPHETGQVVSGAHVANLKFLCLNCVHIVDLFFSFADETGSLLTGTVRCVTWFGNSVLKIELPDQFGKTEQS